MPPAYFATFITSPCVPPAITQYTLVASTVVPFGISNPDARVTGIPSATPTFMIDPLPDTCTQ